MSVLQTHDPTLVGGFAGVSSSPAAAPTTRVWLDRRHPEYATYRDHWEFLRQSYVGGPEYLRANLFSHARERADDLANRLLRAHHYNLSRKIVDILNGYLWERPPARSATPPPGVAAFWEDADGAGAPIDAVMASRASPWAMTYGRLFAIVDKPAAVVETRADEVAGRLFPYVTFYAPTDVLDARVERGRVVWLLLREAKRDDADPRTSSGDVEERFRLWTTADWSLWRLETTEGGEARAVLEDEGPNPLGEVPVVAVDFRAPESFFVAPSLLWEIAYLDRAVYNHISLLDENLYDTTLSQLRIPWQALLAGQVDSEAGARGEAKAEVLEMSTKRALVYDATSPTAPDWIAPSAEPARVIMERLKQEIDDLFRHVALSGEMAVTVSEASGVSKEHEFRKLNKLLATIADNLEKAERGMARLADLWMGGTGEVPKDLVDYPEDFDVRTLMDDLAELQEMAKADLPRPALAEARREVIRKRFPKLPEKQMLAILAAVDESEPEFDVDAALAEMRRREAEVAAGEGGGGSRGEE